MANRLEIITVMYLFAWKQQRGGSFRDRESTFTSQAKVGCSHDTTEGRTAIPWQLPSKCRKLRDGFGAFLLLSYSQKEGEWAGIIFQVMQSYLTKKVEFWGLGSWLSG